MQVGGVYVNPAKGSFLRARILRLPVWELIFRTRCTTNSWRRAGRREKAENGYMRSRYRVLKNGSDAPCRGVSFVEWIESGRGRGTDTGPDIRGHAGAAFALVPVLVFGLDRVG